MRKMGWTCPHCGNRNRKYIEDNQGVPAPARFRPNDPDLTLLCMKPCKVGESSFDHLDDDDPLSRVCGAQWEPNSYTGTF